MSAPEFSAEEHDRQAGKLGDYLARGGSLVLWLEGKGFSAADRAEILRRLPCSVEGETA